MHDSQGLNNPPTGGHPFASEGRCVVIAEVAQAHDGSLGTAHAYVDAVARTGADAVKFQTHIAEAESTHREPWRVRFSPQDETRYDYWKRMEWSEGQWRGLADHAREAGLHFLSSPFSPEATDILRRVGVAAWKVASGELSNIQMLDDVAKDGLPVLISTGMSPLSEIDAAVERIRGRAPVIVMQCTTSYPCPAERVGLNMIDIVRARYDCPAGLSDHSGTIFPGIVAAYLGAVAVEVHVTLSREAFGPDVPASVTTAELHELVRGVRFAEAMRTNPVDKDVEAAGATELRDLFGKSIVAARDLRSGTKLTEAFIALRKPGSGLGAHRLGDVLGRTLRRDVSKNDQIRDEDLDVTT